MSRRPARVQHAAYASSASYGLALAALTLAVVAAAALVPALALTGG